MSITMWIDGDDLQVDQVGFLIEAENCIRGSDSHYLADRPACGNQSGMPRIRGWCGTTNDVAVYGRGLWRVVKIARNGRAKIEELTDRSAIESALDELGYPDLLDDALPKESDK